MMSSGGRKTTSRAGRGVLTCEIDLLDQSSLQQVYKRKALGQEVFDAVCRTLEVLEVEYFGLLYETAAGLPAWLDLSKPVNKQVSVKGSGTVHVEFRVKFFVRNPNQLQDEYTRYLFALQLKRDIYSKRLPCHHQAAAKLLAILTQGEVGDYDPELHQPGYVNDVTLLPNQPPELLSDAESHHQSSWCSGLSPAECDFLLVDLARRLPSYGVEKYPLNADNGEQYELAVSHEGVLVLLFGERHNTFSWPFIDRCSYKGKKFILYMHGRGSSPILFPFLSARQCKRCWQFVIEYHTFFRRVNLPSHSPVKRRSLLRGGSKHRFSGRTQSQVIRELRLRTDVVLHSERSTSPSFIRYSSTRKSSSLSRKVAGGRQGQQRGRLASSPASLTNVLPAVSVMVTTPERESATFEEPAVPVDGQSETSTADIHGIVSPTTGYQKGSAVVTKTEVAITAEALTAEEREPAEVAGNGRIPTLVLPVQTPSPEPEEDADLTPLNRTPRDASVLERTFSSQLRETHVSDLSELVERFSTPDFSTGPSPTKSEPEAESSRPESPAVTTQTGGDDDGQDILPETGHPEAGEATREQGIREGDEDCTPVPSEDESPRQEENGVRASQENHQFQIVNRNSAVPESSVSHLPHLQNNHRPLSRISGSTISDSSDDNLSMSEERTIRLLKRRITKKSKKQPASKAYYISQELRDTERSYILDLELLNVKFRNAIKIAGALSEENVNELFSQLEDLLEFHLEMIVELENRMIRWEGRTSDAEAEEFAYIGDIMSRRMSQMRIYTPYIMSQSQILTLVQQWADESDKFRDLYNKFEAEECHLPLLEFFNRPMQRMVHYKLLLDRLIKAYDSNHPDVPNLKSALESVSDAAEYTNRQCRLAENVKKLEELQQELSGVENLVKPGRYLLREGRLQKAGGNGVRQRHFLLFNDILIYAVARALGLPQVKSTISLKEARVEICEESSPYGENSFALFTRSRSFVLIARSVRERDAWVEDIFSAIEETNGMLEASRTPSVSDLGQLNIQSSHSGLHLSEEIVLTAPVLMPYEAFDSCQRCRAEFTLTKRKHHCAGCGQVMCSTCLQHSATLPFYNVEKKRRVCRDCFGKFQAVNKGEGEFMNTLELLTKSVARNPSFTAFQPIAPASPAHSSTYSSDPRLSIPSAMRKGESSGSILSVQSGMSDDSSIFELSRAGSVRMSIPNGLESHGIGESLAQVAEVPVEDTFESGAMATGGVGGDQGDDDLPSPVHVRRPRAQTYDPVLIREQGSASSFRPSIVSAMASPLRRNTSMRYDSAKRIRRKRRGVMDDEGIATSVANHMSGYLVCKVDDKWTRYWVVCTSYSLFFYSTHNETKPLLAIALPEYELSRILPEDGAICELPHSFKLSNEITINCFVADSDHAMDRWLEVIRNCRAGPSQESTHYLVEA